MASNDILSEFNPADVNHFKKDFAQMVRVGSEIDRCYGEAKHDLVSFMQKYEKLAEQFNKKYKGLKIKPKKTAEGFRIRIFVNAKSIKDFFAETASRIAGLRAIGRTNFNQADISDTEKFSSLIDSLKNEVYLSYMDPESGTSTISAEFEPKQKMVELVYNPDEIANENSAGFRICAFYALKQGYNPKIEIYGDASTFGFSNLLNEIEKREWFDKFNPGNSF